MGGAPYLSVTDAAGRAFFMRNIQGPVMMLNLLRFRATADYSASPELAPDAPITGEQAFQRYIDHTKPYLAASGGKIRFLGKGGSWLIGPEDEAWDMAMLIEQESVASFIGWNSHEDYLKGIGHRTAALLDSRLLPLVETTGASAQD
ncbi:DUF1330 domain-containing protein [Sphingorhabdus pulchriflava]|uniref:DUF1330 domain-containing protein n=1 Tax=Sphingorhabdus pulchriflava TaxID=2292257 RepID=A0A371BF59_9SPHN|nr:DUF1330 domain-containing protein [Sphingorhabdus pulchriflava]